MAEVTGDFLFPHFCDSEASDVGEAAIDDLEDCDNMLEGEVERNLETEDLTDQLMLVLPDVPQDSDSFTADLAKVCGDDIDQQIQQRLTKLQFFSQTWAKDSSKYSSSLPHTALSEVLDVEVDTKASDDDIAPVMSTEEDRAEFNKWYYAKVDGLPCQSNLPHSAASTLITTSTLNMPSQPNSNMISTSELQCSDKVITSQSSDPFMTSSTCNMANLERRRQEQQLEIITNLCFMQANVVAMLMTAIHILEKINRSSRFASKCDHFTNGPASAPMVTQPIVGDFLPAQEVVEPGQGGVQVTSVTSAQCCVRVTPWRKKGLIFTKLF